MGYVFTPEEVSNGEVPVLSDYVLVESELKELLQGLASSGEIHGAIFYGSFKDNDWGIGSDLDVMLAYDSSRADGIRKALGGLNSRHVPVEFVPLQTDYADPFNFPPHFVEYMKLCNSGGVVGVNPVSFLEKEPADGQYRDGIRNEIRSKVSSLAKTGLNNNRFSKGHARVLEKLMRWPLYIARTAIQFKMGYLPTDSGRILTKREIAGLYAEEFPDAPAETVFTAAVISREYKKIMSGAGQIEDSEYKDVLNKIDSTFGNVNQFLRFNATYMGV